MDRPVILLEYWLGPGHKSQSWHTVALAAAGSRRRPDASFGPPPGLAGPLRLAGCHSEWVDWQVEQQADLEPTAAAADKRLGPYDRDHQYIFCPRNIIPIALSWRSGAVMIPSHGQGQLRT